MTSPLGELPIGGRLRDRFEITGELGRGGYSIVYAAIDHAVARPVAIKVLVPPPVAAHEAKERLKREVQTFRSVRHPNIVGVHDFLEDGGVAFVVMDLVDGPDLATRIDEQGALDVDRVVAIGRDVAAALTEAHLAGICHRDIKPANILLDADGRARLTDFGAARLDSSTTLTRTGGLVGTVAYLAPEVWLGERPDARADIYALGLTLYQALTGVLPDQPAPHLPPTPDPDGHHPAARRPDLPAWLDRAVATATAADPRRRFTTATQFAAALIPQAAQSVAAAVAPQPSRKRTWPIGFVVLIGGVMAMGLLAGVAASPHFFWATPCVAALLIRAARRDRDAESNPPASEPARWTLSRQEQATVATIPDGPTRHLLDDILIVSRQVLDHAATSGLRNRWREQLTPAIGAAIEGASDLADIDDLLRRMTRAQGRPKPLPSDWWDTVARLERTRDTLSTALLDLLGSLGKARQAEIVDLGLAPKRLLDAVAEVGSHVDRHLDAVRTVEAASRA